MVHCLNSFLVWLGFVCWRKLKEQTHAPCVRPGNVISQISSSDFGHLNFVRKPDGRKPNLTH